jgi:hypothetical protein
LSGACLAVVLFAGLCYMEDELMVELSENNTVDIITLHKMIFIYNAVMNGWTVKKGGQDNFEFTKELDEHAKREVNLSNYIKNFILHSLHNLTRPGLRG